MARIPLGASRQTINDLQAQTFVGATLDGLPAVAVVNPDGSSISAGGAGNVNLNQVGGVNYALGPTTMANSLPVTIATNQTPIPVSGTFSSTPTPDATPSTQNITVQDTGSTTATTNANAQSFRTGTPTVNSTALFTLASWETASIEVTGTWTGTLLIEGSFDGGVTYYQKAVKQIGTSYIANNFTANFAGTVNVATLTHIAVRSLTAWTGTATVTVRQSVNNNGIYIHNGLTIQDGTIQTNKLTVKSASTAATTTDPSVVVALSPNSNSVGTTSRAPSVGQTTSGTSPVQLSSTSTVSTNGILVQAISTNTASVFVGPTGVSTSTGFELQPGQAVPFTASNITALYVVGANTSDKVCWNVM